MRSNVANESGVRNHSSINVAALYADEIFSHSDTADRLSRYGHEIREPRAHRDFNGLGISRGTDAFYSTPMVECRVHFYYHACWRCRYFNAAQMPRASLKVCTAKWRIPFSLSLSLSFSFPLLLLIRPFPAHFLDERPG